MTTDNDAPATSTSPDIPPFQGYVETTTHALRLIHAARQGVIPRITRRLNDQERKSMIKSGAVFVFSVEESGIKRWTDGYLWSPSRISGNFLVYREINERSNSRISRSRHHTSEERALHRTSPSYKPEIARHEQGSLKTNGLIKKTITVNVEGSDLHLISYYTFDDVKSGKLKKPSARADIMELSMSPQLFRHSNFRVPPKFEVGSDGRYRLVPDPEGQGDSHIGVKSEEMTYSVPSSPSSPGDVSSPENSYRPNPIYPITALNDSASGQSNSRSNRQWSTSPDATRVPTPMHQTSSSAMMTTMMATSGRQNTGMAMNPPSVHQHSASWPSPSLSMSSQSSRWSGSSSNYSPEFAHSRVSTPTLQHPRSRAAYPITSHTPGYSNIGSRYAVRGSSANAQRAWYDEYQAMLNNNSKASSTIPNRGSGYTSSLNYSYPSYEETSPTEAWSSNESSSLGSSYSSHDGSFGEYGPGKLTSASLADYEFARN